MDKYRVMKACPRYRGCNVPICPLDPDKHKRSKIKGEKNCTMTKEKLDEIRLDASWAVE